MILLDTNLLVRMTRPRDPQCGVARAAIQTYRARGERLIVVPQNLYEFWAVATRPLGAPPAGGNGLGMTTGHTAAYVQHGSLQWFADNDSRSRCAVSCRVGIAHHYDSAIHGGQCPPYNCGVRGMV